MTEAEQFAAIDACVGNTMIVFSDAAIAHRYVEHMANSERPIAAGVIALVGDTRTKSGLCVMWRDPVHSSELERRHANCRWLLEEVLAGRYPRPVAGEVGELWTGGFPGGRNDG